MQDLEQFSYWQEKPLTSSHCYDIYNPVISVELKELADRVVANNDLVVEIQLDLCIQQLRVPAWHESLLMSMGDALLRALQRWILDYKSWVPYKIRMLCFVASSKIVTSAFNKMSWGVDKYSHLCIFFPWTCNLARTMLALFDWLSYRWLMTQLQAPCMEFQLAIILIHENNSA